MPKDRVVIMGAAGRDFHNFNVCFRDNENYKVVAFTATQIPNIERRTYPPELSGLLYPQGIPIYPEEELTTLIQEHDVDQAIFAYSDISHQYVMHKASEVLAAGADFRLLGPKATMLKAGLPVISVCAVRTGSGKSQTSRRVSDILKEMGKKVVVVRHPMPYGDLAKQACQRFATYEDLDRHECTLEEREDYEPHINRGTVVYAGVDYEEILRHAEAEADIILWDGGNNDLPFYQPDLHIVVADPHRPGHELRYHPGETNVRLADVVIINKIDTAKEEDVALVEENIKKLNPKALVVKAHSPIFVEDPGAIKGKRVLVIEDGPTLTHGEMAYGAGVVAARRFGAREIIDPRPYAVGSIREIYARYPTTGPVLPAMGYGQEQIKELQATINSTPCDLVLVATPIDLRRLIDIEKPSDRVRYELEEISRPNLEEVIGARLG